MPEIDGETLLEMIMNDKVLKEIPVVIMSANES
jgi:CheY-like chemotaxis protein